MVDIVHKIISYIVAVNNLKLSEKNERLIIRI